MVADEPPAAADATDAELRRALATSVQGVEADGPIASQVTAIAWKQLAPDIRAAGLWSDIRLRAAITTCAGANPDPADPLRITVTLVWSGERTAIDTVEIHRSKLTVEQHAGQWRPL